jgi:uridine kinase
MIGDNILIQPKYLHTAAAIRPYLKIGDAPICIAIGGESGSGKTVTALAIAQLLQEENSLCVVLHQDDYFKLPPKSNHAKRILDIRQVGMQELHFELLQKNIHDFFHGVKSIEKPLVDYDNNLILQETIALDGVKVLIIEGTYSMLLKEVTHKIFMKRNYHDTYLNRLARGRDIATDFVEQVLEIEHQLIAPLLAKADIIVEKDYTVVKC